MNRVSYDHRNETRRMGLQGLPSQTGIVLALSIAVNTHSGSVNPQLGTLIFTRTL